jgi:dolichol kinase
MIILAVYFKNDIIFAAAMLQLGVADGMAAVIGTRYGRRTTFRVMGSKKSWHGTITFFVFSSAIFCWAIWALHPDMAFSGLMASTVTLVLSLALGFILTIAELTGKNGIDNITVPLLTAISLSLLS